MNNNMSRYILTFLLAVMPLGTATAETKQYGGWRVADDVNDFTDEITKFAIIHIPTIFPGGNGNNFGYLGITCTQNKVLFQFSHDRFVTFSEYISVRARIDKNEVISLKAKRLSDSVHVGSISPHSDQAENLTKLFNQMKTGDVILMDLDREKQFKVAIKGFNDAYEQVKTSCKA